MNKREVADSIIEQGQAQAAAVIERVREATPRDLVVPAALVQFSPELEMVLGNTSRKLHQNALDQAAAKVGLGMRFVNRYREEEWGAAMLADVLSETWAHTDGNVLLRSVYAPTPEVRGVVSDTFARWNGAALVDGMIEALGEVGAVPVGGVAGDLRFSIRAVLPTVFEIQGDPVLVGLSLRTSDFGKGCLALQKFMLRVLCGNGQTRENLLRKVHLGSRISGDARLSEETMRLDTATMVSAIKDLTRAHLSTDNVEKEIAVAEIAAKTKVSPEQAEAIFLDAKKAFSAKTIENVKKTISWGDETMVPPGEPTLWKIANGFSYEASHGAGVSAEQRMDMEDFAASLMTSPVAKAAARSGLLDNILDAVN